MEKTYIDRNPLFDLLAANSDTDDLEGLVAYALYKKHKRSWARSFREKHSSEPTVEQEHEFARSCSTQDQLERYRKDAQDILLSFASQFVDGERAEIERQAIAGRIDKSVMRIEESLSFMSLLKVGITSTVLTSAFVALLAFGAQYFGIDLVDALTSSDAELPE